MGVTIERVDSAGARAALPELVALLEDSVIGGASVGFLLPLAAGEVERYWAGVLSALAAGEKLLFIARAGGRVIGSVQVAPEPRANGSHRAEVQKLLVLRSARRRGVGRALMEAAEGSVRELGRFLIVLDTREGDDGERLYRSMGYQLAGVIPRYARRSGGGEDGSAFMYKLLGDG